jgi:hypothetical protein
MRSALLPTCRIGLLTTLLAASFPQASLAVLTGSRLEGGGTRYVFRVSSTPLAGSSGG